MPPHDVDMQTAQDLLRIPPFHRYLGLEMEALDADSHQAVVRMPFREELIGNPQIPAIHGGILAALIDLTGGVSTFSATGVPTPTIDMQVDYVRPALAEEGRAHLATAEIVNLGRTVAFVEVEVRPETHRDPADRRPEPVEDRSARRSGVGKLVAKGRCVYSTKHQEEGVPEEDRYPIG